MHYQTVGSGTHTCRLLNRPSHARVGQLCICTHVGGLRHHGCGGAQGLRRARATREAELSAMAAPGYGARASLAEGWAQGCRRLGVVHANIKERRNI
jgi:hypothetical protein